MRAAVLSIGLSLAVLGSGALRAASPEPVDVTRTTTQAGFADDSVTLAATAVQAAKAEPFSPVTWNSRPAAPAPAPDLTRHLRAEICGVYSAAQDSIWPCAPEVTYDHTDLCGDRPALRPWWESTRATAQTAWSGWTLIADVTCTGGPRPIPEDILAEFRRLPITPSVLHLQPDRGWVLVNKETIAYADSAPQVLSTEVLGTTVTFTITPTAFTWDYGEHSFTTTSPGHPYPHQDVSYPYKHPGTGQVTLTTTWSATYTLADDPTALPVPGTATTSTTSAPFEIREAAAHLTRGSCDQHPHDPGC